MADLCYTRLLYSVILAALLAALGYAFIPSKSRFRDYVERYSNRLIWIMWVGAALVLWGMGALKFVGMHNSEADLGLYANTLWVTLHGKLLGTALTSGTYLDCHFSPSFLVLALLYAPWQSPVWLIGMQDITAASGALALYLLVRQMGSGKLAGLMFGFVWLSSFALRGAILYDFHEVTMVSGLLMWLTYLIMQKNWMLALLLTLFLLGIKEDMPVYLAVLGILIAGSFKQWKWGLLLIGISIAYYLLVQTYIWPLLAPLHLDFVAIRFPVLATEDGNVPAHVFSNPVILLNFLNHDYSIWLLLMIVLPVLFLPFLRWGSIGLLLPLWMVVNLDITGFYIFATYHHICPVALFFIASIPGWFWLQGKIKSGKRMVNWLLLGMGLALNLALPQDILFSQFSPASYAAHPSFERASKLAHETPPLTSIAVDRMMGSLYTDHYFLDNFPSNVITDRLYLSPLAIGFPEMTLAIGGLGYKGVKPDPYLWFLAKDGELGVKESFMDRMHWMEAENSNLPAWQLVSDLSASGGQALYLPDCGDWGQRIVNTPTLILPPGDYSYGIRLRTVRSHRWHPRVYVEVRSVNPTGEEIVLAGYNMLLNESYLKPSYKTMHFSFKTSEWAHVYLNINFSQVGDIFWDGVSLEGLNNTFESYYQKLFPLSLEAYKCCTDSSLVIPDEDSYSGKVVQVSEETRDREIIRWDLDDQIAEGVHKLYYTVKSPESLPDDLDWAIVFSSDTPNDISTYQEIATLRITRDYMNRGCRHLESLLFSIKPHSTLIIWVKDDLDKKILLDKLWISPLL